MSLLPIASALRPTNPLPMWRGRLATWMRPREAWLLPSEGDTAHAGVPPHDAALLVWRAWCAEHRGQRCRLNLSSRWQLHMMVPPKNGRAPADARQAAATQWQHYLGCTRQTWEESWMLKAGTLGRHTWVTALPRAMADDLMSVARHHGVEVIWMGPWWLRGALRWLHHGADGSAHPRGLTLTEPGWSVHLLAMGAVPEQIWGSPTVDDASPASGERGLTNTVVRLPSSAGGPLPSCGPSHTDESLHAVLDGSAECWLGHEEAAR